MKYAVITGGSSGIGKQTTKALIEQGYAVIIAARDKAKGDALVADILLAHPEASIEFHSVDMANSQQVAEFGQYVRNKWQVIDALVLNAGLFTNQLTTTPEGYETMFATTHLGHFLLTHYLLDAVKASADGRVVVTSSVAHFFSGGMRLDTLRQPSTRNMLLAVPFRYYGQSKLANLLFVRELARQVEGSNIKVNSLHPGGVKSGFWRDTPSVLNMIVAPALVSEEKGAQTMIYLATAPEVTVSGQHWFKKRVEKGSPTSRNAQVAKQLWDYSEQAMGITQFGTL